MERAVKPSAFAYHRPSSINEAVNILAASGGGAKVIAGGQSLVPMMNFRLARPETLVDVGRIPGLGYVLPTVDGEGLRIGALTRHRQLERFPGGLDGFEVLREAAGWIGHYAIRDRGTFGGSIAHADASAEWCLVTALLDGRITVAGPAGHRTIEAERFFEGFLETNLAPDEIIIEVSFPRGRQRYAVEEFSRRHGDFAIVAAIVAFNLVDEQICDCRIVLGGVAAIPIRVPEVEAALEGQRAESSLFREAAERCAVLVDPPSDLHGTGEYRRDLVRTLVRRAFERAVGR